MAAEEQTRKPQNRLLVTYAGRHGSSREVAQVLAQSLSYAGFKAKALPVGEVTDLAGYSGAVVGSAVYFGQWLDEAMAFVIKNKAALGSMPVAYYLTCLTLARHDLDHRRVVSDFMRPLMEKVPEVKPISLTGFAGKLDYERLSRDQRAKLQAKMWPLGIDQGDYRDFAQVRNWAKGELATGFNATIKQPQRRCHDCLGYSCQDIVQ